MGVFRCAGLPGGYGQIPIEQGQGAVRGGSHAAHGCLVVWTGLRAASKGACVVLADRGASSDDERMDISLPPHLRRFVNAKLRSGDFKTVSEVVREGLAHYAATERDREKQRAEFQRAVRKGLASAKAGRLIDGERAFDRLEVRLEKSMQRRRRA